VLSPPRLAVVCDFREEGWPSMDLVADMLLSELQRERSRVLAERVMPPFRRRLSRVSRGSLARNADRLANRMWNYPRYVRRLAGSFHLFHIVDHSYAHLVHELPAHRCGVYCHDLDTFRCILEPARDPRPRWFRAMARRILRGMQAAAIVFYSTDAVRRQIEEHKLVPASRLVHAPYGVSPDFSERGGDETPAEEGSPYVLHVGSCIPRKRIDVLLDVFARVRSNRPELKLIQIGGEWSSAQRDQIASLGLERSVDQRKGLSRPQLATLYRNAAVVLQPSDYEGFGLPVIEALACGAAVVASDMPVLREVGGDAVIYRPVGDVAGWSEAVNAVLNDGAAPPSDVRRARAERFTWANHARTIADAYLKLLD
jgi:glycosyltransferase involved in cell wall biosynthesis